MPSRLSGISRYHSFSTFSTLKSPCRLMLGLGSGFLAGAGASVLALPFFLFSFFRAWTGANAMSMASAVSVIFFIFMCLFYGFADLCLTKLGIYFVFLSDICIFDLI